MTSKITYFFEYFKYLKNPISCLLFKFGLKKEVTIKFKNTDYELAINSIQAINKIMSLIRWYEYTPELGEYVNKLYSDDEIFTVFEDIKIYNPTIYPLNEIFMEYFVDYYNDFDIDYKDRIIIDIGANSGDTALYFASKGATVYGFEPVREYYEMALKNFDLNPDLSKNIKIFNYGVSYKKGKINIDAMDSTSRYVSEGDSYSVDIIPINDIMNQVTPDLLKMDCEGCEFEIIENCDLSKFNEIIFEQHSRIVGKDAGILIDSLKKSGFKIEIASVFGENLDDLSLIHAYK